MTSTQIAILVGLAAAVCLLFTVAGWLVLRGGPRGLAPAPQNTVTPQPTATPFVLPTASPTATLTPVPYEMLIPDGWVQFKTDLVEIWLPKEFKRTDPKKFGNAANLAVPELVLIETASKSSLYNMVVAISYEPLTADSLDAYLTSEIADLPPDARVTDRRMVTVNSQDVVRLVFEMRRDSVDVNDLVYVFLDGTTVWYVEYAAQINEFFEKQELFEKSVKTFRFVR